MDVVAKNLSMNFDDAGRKVEVFRDLELNVRSGTSVSIVGESGVGKTTLLYLLGGLEQPSSGDVCVGNSSYQELAKQGNALAQFRGKNLGFVFQFHHLLPEFDAVENVAMPLLIRGEKPEVARKRAEDLLGRTGLSHRLSHRPGALSGGEQQRVALARAFAASPGVVLADEPTGNLDHRTGAGVIELMHRFQQELGITLIVVTHSLELARSMNRVLELTADGLIER